MSRLTSITVLKFTFSLLLAASLASIPFANAAEERPLGPDQGEEVFPIDAFFASLVKAGEDIEFLASRKRYQELLTVAGRLSQSLEQANTILPADDPQRAARFIATSRSLNQICKAVHSYMWNGKNEELFETVDKLERLVVHMRTLITPEELARAHANLKLANG